MLKKGILFLLLIAWFLLAVFSVGYNMLHTVSEVKNWYFLTDTQKREKIFGDLYTFFMFVDKHTSPNAQILILSSDVRTFYLGRYYLYPKRITVASSAKEIDRKTLPIYIASYGTHLMLKNYKIVEAITLPQTKQQGFLYKKQ